MRSSSALASCVLLLVVTVTIADSSDQSSLSFVMLGDWGGKESPPYYTNSEKEIAEQMGSVAEDINAQFTIALGDNFYDHGVKDVNDERFQTTFEVIIYDYSIWNSLPADITSLLGTQVFYTKIILCYLLITFNHTYNHNNGCTLYEVLVLLCILAL